MNLEQMLKAKTGKEISDSTNEEIYTALLEIVQELAQEKATIAEELEELYEKWEELA